MTKPIMTEEQIRAIVRDELEAEALKPDGIYDHVRKIAFNLIRSMLQMQAQQTLESFKGSESGLN